MEDQNLDWHVGLHTFDMTPRGWHIGAETCRWHRSL